MDIWENLINTCASYKDITNFKKAVSSARSVLASDLTVFEIDWFVSTLLEKPVLLLFTLEEKRGEPVWAECLVDALTLLANLLQNKTGLHQYYHKIVQVCLMVYMDGACRTPALTCLLHISLHSAAPANHLQRFLAEFESPRVPSRGTLGLLIGSICRSRPQVVDDQGERIWRVFLRVLDDEQLSGTARAAVLEGASGILSACGLELPTADLIVFYNLLRANALHSRCHTVSMRILWCHVALFSERACEDVALRTRLWEHGGVSAYQALTAIYGQMALDTQSHETLTAEVMKYATAPQAAARVVALRALHELNANLLNYIHVPNLECKLRRDLVENDDVLLMAWCIESEVSGASVLINAWVERSTPLLESNEKHLARAVLSAPYSMRRWVIKVIVTESCRSSGLQRCVALCKHLFEVTSETNENDSHDNGKAEMMDELVKRVLNVVRSHSTCCRKCECGPIVGVCALVCVALRSGCSGADVAGARLVGALSRCTLLHPSATPAALCAALAAPLSPPTNELKVLRVESLLDADLQWQCCEVVCACRVAPPPFLAHFTLAAAEIVLSSDCDTSLLCSCIRTLYVLTHTHRNLDKQMLNQVRKRISVLPARQFARTRPERELRHEILLFLGHHPMHTPERYARRATQLPIHRLNVASALESATFGPSLNMEKAQEMADTLSEILRDGKSYVDLAVVTWLARSGADLLPFTPVFPHRDLHQLFRSVERERCVVTRKALAALATAVLTALPTEYRDAQLRVLLTDQDSTPEGRSEMLLAASRAVRDDDLSLNGALQRALAIICGTHLASSLMTSVPPARLLTSLHSGLFESFAHTEFAHEIADLIVEAFDSCVSCVPLFEALNALGTAELSGRICGARDQVVPRKLFARGCTGDVAVQFMAWNINVLMEINSEATMDTLCSLIENLQVFEIRTSRSHLAECVHRVRLEADAHKLHRAVDNWLSKRLWVVADVLKRRVFKTDVWEVVKGVRDMIKATGVKSDLLRVESIVWARTVRELYNAGITCTSQKPYLIDVLRVALPALNAHEFADLFKDDLEFCKWSCPALVYYVEENGTERLLALTTRIAELLPMFCVSVEFVDQLWPDFESISTFEERMDAALAVGAGEACLWAERVVSDASPLQVLRLLPLLPSSMHRRVVSSALASAGVIGAGGVACAKDGVEIAAVRALLAATPTLELIDIIATLADDETECDWFEAALSLWARNAVANACAADIITRLHELCWDARTLGILRLLLPMLRSIKPTLLEGLMSKWSNRLTGALSVRSRPCSDRRALTRCLNGYVKALTLLTVAFERVPRAHHERADAELHRGSSAKPFHLVRVVCTHCVALRESLRGSYDDNLQELFRVFECANFKCLSAALFCRQGASSSFRAILDDGVWERLVQTSVSLPLITRTNYATPTPESTQQSRVFLSTLTDDPLLYDLHEGIAQTEPDEAVTNEKVDTLWQHECASTLSILLRHSVRALPTDLYLTPLRSALAASRAPTLRWLLAQAICDEPTLIDTLRDDLLSVVLDADGLLNRLHLYILTVIKPVPLDEKRAIGVLSALVCTAVEFGSRCPRLIETLEGWSRAHSGLVLPDTCYKEYVTDSGYKRWSCMSVMRRVCSCGVRVSGLALELGRLAVTTPNDMRTLRSIGATLGGALAAEADVACDHQTRKAMLALRKEGGAGAYLTLLAATASIYPAIINTDHARTVTDMSTKIIGRDKQKCLRVLCAYANGREQSDELIADIFDLMEPMASSTCDPLIIDLCTASLTYARQAARVRVVAVAVQVATPSTLASATLQRASCLLLFAEITLRVKAVRELRNHAQPATKRRAGCVNSPILADWEDMLWRGVLTCTVTALEHADSKIVNGALQTLSGALSVDDHYTRLSESVLLHSLSSSSFHVALRLYLSDVLLPNSDRHTNILNTLLSSAQGSEAVACSLSAAIAQRADGSAVEREKLITILADNCEPAILELLHELVPSGRQIRYRCESRDPVLIELRRRATLTCADNYAMGYVTERSPIDNFSIEAMSKCFGLLCEWERWGVWCDNVIPKLWTDSNDFRREMESHNGELGWLRAMFSGLNSDSVDTGLYRILLAADRWPRDGFALSAVCEVGMWKEGEYVAESNCVCLAQMAALLLMRTLRLQTEPSDVQAIALHRNMVEWCSRVNNAKGMAEALRVVLLGDAIRICQEMETTDHALNNVRIEQLVTARRGLAMLNTPSDLAETLEFAELEWCNLNETSPNLRLMELVLKLRADTNGVSRSGIQDMISRIRHIPRDDGKTRALTTIAEQLYCLFEISADVGQKYDMLSEMYETIELSGGVGRARPIVDMLLACLLRLPREYHPQSIIHKLSKAEDLEDYQREAAQECGVPIVEVRSEWAQHLALVRDPQHGLLHSCALLLRAAASEDEERWRDAVSQARGDYPDAFVGLSTEITDDAVRVIRMVQKTAQTQLDVRGDGALRLSSLSPALASLPDSPSLASLLGLPPHLRVHRFEEKIEVFADSARRPCVLRARLSNGAARRWLVKAEPARADRAAMAFAQALRRCHTVRAQYVVGYVVRSLTADCSLIEFLEDHQRLDQVASTASALTLRESMRKRSVSAQHFLEQQRLFSETVSASTMLTAVLGVGDRHPQNLLVGDDGALVHVDWTSAPRHDALSREPTPVRLTRNMIAFATGLESLILEWSEVIREHAVQLVAVLRVVYRYLPESQIYKVEMMEQLVRGQRAIHQLALQQLRHQRRQCGLGSVLADVFHDFPHKDMYSVHDQVYSLLRMSTEPRVLALARPAWQPNM